LGHLALLHIFEPKTFIRTKSFSKINSDSVDRVIFLGEGRRDRGRRLRQGFAVVALADFELIIPLSAGITDVHHYTGLTEAILTEFWSYVEV
jgi:hypothetical protein